ncbi:hypothetical protein AeNC1_011543, partial [Aphanomyces euteiches]
MTKVHVARRQEASVHLSRWSVAYNLMFVFNLATTPFMAYITEPFPGIASRASLPYWNSYEEYTDVMAAFFQSLQTIPSPQVFFVQDRASNTFAARLFVDLPFSIPESQVSDYFFQLPGSAFFGAGVEAYMTRFLSSNSSSREALKPGHVCEHEYLLSISLGELCYWMIEHESFEPNAPPVYDVWAAIYCHETQFFCWFKFTFRSFVTTYVLRVLWRRYYRQYGVLISNLRTVGLDPEYIGYRIVLGDPGYAVLSDPLVALAIFIDICQFQDLWTYALGCIYLSRTVWFAYLCMRVLYAVVKWRRWEASFVPVDPGFLAISAYLYGGPMTSFITMTPVWLFRQMWHMFLPETLKDKSIQCVVVCVAYTMALPQFPLIYSLVASYCSGYRKRHAREVHLFYSAPSYNDLKAIVLLSIIMRKDTSCASVGGSLHELYHKDPR